jgi:hypothetical protein
VTQEKTQEIEQRSTFKLVFGITYWMGIQGVTAWNTLHNYATGKTGLMWFSGFLVLWATLMVWYKLDKWRTP